MSNNLPNRDYPALENCLFGAVSLTKNTDFDKYKHHQYGIGFDRHESYSHPSGGKGRDVVIFTVDMGSITKTDEIRKYIL